MGLGSRPGSALQARVGCSWLSTGAYQVDPQPVRIAKCLGRGGCRVGSWTEELGPQHCQWWLLLRE